MYNNQRFESPSGVARYKLPLPSNPETYNNGSSFRAISMIAKKF